MNEKYNTSIMKGKLPDFLIIGTQKGGTVSLWHNLKKHPDIEFCPNFSSSFDDGGDNEREVHFFDKNWDKGIEWYKSLFNNNSKLQGECTPEYIFYLNSHKRMFETLPNAKLIFIIRNPITRAYSSYNHQLQQGFTWENDFSIDSSFDEAINEVFNKDLMMDFVSIGFYINQIKHLLKYFKKEQLLILISEQMRKNPQETYNKIFDFLGLKRFDIDYTPNIHSRKYKEPMKEETRKKLKEIYKPYNERLFEFLGYRIKEWD
ncbi:sulfotransferase domain-containing protein [Candidatus Woesearchaeota archaeon]|nr:sulfotransferase domain-containing protein [Candidatus Woesearchaeota archaeon]